MSIIKETKIDQITVSEVGMVIYRQSTSVLEDGNEIAKTYHRTSLMPGQDISDQPQNVVAICNAAWTPEVVAEFQRRMAAQQGAQA